ncbi:MAG: helix-turn-helix domain-containing protein [Prevotella sp.]|nr:helix-turn-helix domain-containing protein [Prevotella sp.]
MRKIDFDDLWQNHLFDYKDGNLLVIDDITRLQLNDYLHTTLAFVMIAYCQEGTMQVSIDEKEYRASVGTMLVYLPGQMMGEILLSPDARIKLIAFAQRAVDRSFYLNKYVWQRLTFIKEHPLFSLSDAERQQLAHYHGLLTLHTQQTEGSFHHDVVRLLFQALVLDLMTIAENRIELVETDTEKEGKDASVRQPTQIYRRFMSLVAESAGRVRSVSVFANMLNVTPKYLSKCVKEESGRSPLDHIHEVTVNTIRQQLRYSSKTIKEIANDLDFPNLSFFGKFVKEHLGLSPTDYRQRNLKDG